MRLRKKGRVVGVVDINFIIVCHVVVLIIVVFFLGCVVMAVVTVG